MYVNWKEECGGSLELWDQEVTHCGAKILPVFNRLAIFSPTSNSFHGHADPLTCPEGDSHKSLALLYYSNGRPEAQVNGAHTTIFAERPHEKIGGLRWRLSQDYTPPVLFRAMRRFRERHLANTIQKRG
jgi:2OG-Fe(II) oxygenase superfamily